MVRAEAWRPLPLLSPPIDSALWEGRGLQLRARRDEVVSEDSEDDYAATGPAKAENVATGRSAMVGDVTWQPGPVAEPLPKKIKGSAGGWADLHEEEHGAATGPEAKAEGDAATGSERKKEGDAATGPATKKEGDAATGPATSSSEEEDEDWSEGASLA